MIEPLVNSLGYELVMLEYATRARGSSTLRVFIDSPNGIGLEDCETVSREVAGLMDVEDPIHGAYRLEISSPGSDRPLVKPEHFERFRGETVRVQMLVPVAGSGRKFRGVLMGMDGEAVVLEVDGQRVALPLADIERARLVPDYDREWKS